MIDFKTLLAGAKLPERTVPICLRGDLTAEFEALEEQLEEALRVPASSLEGDGSAGIAEQIEALREQMQAHTYRFRLRAMPHHVWMAFCADHPPRKDDDGGVDERDKLLGVNAETFWPALVRRSVVDPTLDDGEWATLGEALTDRQFNALADAAWALNRREIDVPFSPAASRMTRGSATE
ncbi:hypothetical protein O7598_30795 [Micromonospora sp. WMMC241]|uniref:hypothetical protein n=1 Tax=Micromonospora sp. WMMC241 TaxID=3015159 RepID=UPI0022B635FA|nr:hypothetical protein [Micromonospora sp. WMMC241]MCZ7440812.1 hypothetical protein [Micromonospora sp. WMMC241]